MHDDDACRRSRFRLGRCFTISAWHRDIPSNRPIGRLRILFIITWVAAILVAVELVAQLREHLRTGQSIFNRLTQHTPDFVVDEQTGLRLLRPNAVIRGQQQEIRSNSLGLRSAEIGLPASANEHRVAVIGASSVMGAYSPTNADTLPAALERRLRQKLPAANVQVINAGIVGYALADQTRMLAYVAERVEPELVFVYPGVNDFAGYCRSTATAAAPNAFRLPQVELPRWLMSVDLLLKNTVALRPAPRMSSKTLDARNVDVVPYRQRVEQLIAMARARGVDIVLSTNARSYRPDQPRAVQEHYARTARYYNPCFDVPGLNILYERHNAVIADVGRKLGVPVIPIGDIVPGGPEYFVDSVHFTAKGKDAVADAFAEYVVRRNASQWRTGP